MTFFALPLLPFAFTILYVRLAVRFSPLDILPPQLFLFSERSGGSAALRERRPVRLKFNLD